MNNIYGEPLDDKPDYDDLCLHVVSGPDEISIVWSLPDQIRSLGRKGFPRLEGYDLDEIVVQGQYTYLYFKKRRPS